MCIVKVITQVHYYLNNVPFKQQEKHCTENTNPGFCWNCAALHQVKMESVLSQALFALLHTCTS